jgi:hypothetical protein
MPRDLHRQRLGPQAVAAAGAAGAVVLVALEFLADPGAVGLAVAAFHVGDHAFEGCVSPGRRGRPRRSGTGFPLAGAAQEDLLHMASAGPSSGVWDRTRSAWRSPRWSAGNRATCPCARARWRRRRGSAPRRAPPGVRRRTAPPPARRRRAGAEGRVEGEQARLDLGDGEAGDRAGEVFGEGDALGLALILPSGRSPGSRCRRRGRARCGTVGQPRLHAPRAPRSGPPPRRCRGGTSCRAWAASSSS